MQTEIVPLTEREPIFLTEEAKKTRDGFKETIWIRKTNPIMN